MKKKSIFACISVILLLMPISAIANPIYIINEGEDSSAVIKISAEHYKDLCTTIRKIGDNSLKQNILDVVDEIISEDLYLDLTDLTQIISECSDLPDDVDDIYDLIKWIIQTIIDSLGTGTEELIENIQNMIQDLFNLINLIIEDIGRVANGLSNPSLDLIYAVIDFASHLTTFLNNAKSIPQNIRFNIQSIVYTTVDNVINVLAEFIVPKTGYIGKFANYGNNILNQAEILKYELEIEVYQFKVVFIEFPKALIDFLEAVDYKSGQEIFRFGQTFFNVAVEAFNIVKAWIADIEDGSEILGALSSLEQNISSLIGYYEDTPWEKPVHVYGIVKNGEGDVTISFVDENQDSSITTTEENRSFSLDFDTNMAANSYSIHSVKIVANDSNGKTLDFNKKSFSDGDIYLCINFSKDKKSKFYYRNVIYELIHKFRFFATTIFDKIITKINKQST